MLRFLLNLSITPQPAEELNELNAVGYGRAGLWVLLVAAVTLPSQFLYPHHRLCIVL